MWLWRLLALPHAPHWAALPHLVPWHLPQAPHLGRHCDLHILVLRCECGRGWGKQQGSYLERGAPAFAVLCMPPGPLSALAPLLLLTIFHDVHPRCITPTPHPPRCAAPTLQPPRCAAPTLQSPRCATPTPQPPRCAAPTLQPLLNLPLQTPRWATPTLQPPHCAD